MRSIWIWVPRLRNTEILDLGKDARQRGFFTKDDLIVICAWKTPRSKPLVKANSPGDVKEVTGLALAAKGEALRIQLPMILSGISWPTSSVLPHLAHRQRYPILDVRALEALGVRGVTAFTLPFWLAYVSTCRGLASQAGVRMRILDRALWQWSKERSKQGSSGSSHDAHGVDLVGPRTKLG